MEAGWKGLAGQLMKSTLGEARKIRQLTAELLASDFTARFSPEEGENKVADSFLHTILERRPFERCLEKLSFSLAVSEKAVSEVLSSSRPIVEKIGLTASLVELGAREFIDPRDVGRCETHLAAAKARGYFFTPVPLGAAMADLGLRDRLTVGCVFDPACGVGTLLALTLVCRPDISSVRGLEIDGFTARLARDLLRTASLDLGITPDIVITQGDFLDLDCYKELANEVNADLAIMNPPYGRVRFLESSLRDHTTRARLTGDEKEELRKRLRRNHMNMARRLRTRFRNFGLGSGTPEYSKLFLASATQLTRHGGRVVAITPSAWLGDVNGEGLRKFLLENHGIEEIWRFGESAGLFEGVNQPTSVVSISVKSPTKTIRIRSGLSGLTDLDTEIEELDVDLIGVISPERRRIPQRGNSRAKILRKLHEHGSLRTKGGVSNLRGELDLTAQRDLLRDSESFQRLVRGDHISRFSLGIASKPGRKDYVDAQTFMQRIERSSKREHIGRWRVSLPQCSYMGMKRRLEACLVPPGSILANSCNYLIDEEDPTATPSDRLSLYCILLNSAVVEWRFRLFSSNNHVANYELDELPIVDLDDCTDIIQSGLTECVRMVKAGNTPTGAKMEALVGVAYGLCVREMELILADLDYPDRSTILLEMVRLLEQIEEANYLAQGSALRGNGWPNHNVNSLSILDSTMVRFITPGGNWMDVPEWVPSDRLRQIRQETSERGIVRTTYYGRLRPDQPAYTISTYFNRPGNGTNIHPWENRTLSAREAARLQSFPDEFVFCGSQGSVQNQVGNAVPPLLAYAIGKQFVGVKYVDLFCGAGGLSYGLELAGAVGIAAQDIDEDACATFQRAFPSSIELVPGDIREPSVQKKLVGVVKAALGNEGLGLLVGGPPCQGFSTAGWRRKDDTRNDLVSYFLDMVAVLEPRWIVIENVPGLLSAAKGRTVAALQEVLRSDLGYTLYDEPWVLKAEQYGAPQMRRRVIIVGAREREELPPAPVVYFDECKGRRETESHRRSPRLSYPITVAEALYSVPNLRPVVQAYCRNLDAVDKTYARWCRGEITVEELLTKRGKREENVVSTEQPLLL
jgi:DNA-cytosine methyltransferase